MKNNSSKNETIVKAYSIPLQPDKIILDFIEEYHKLAKITLEKNP